MATRRFCFKSHSAIAKKASPPPAEGKAKDVLYFDDRGDPPGFGIRVGRARAKSSPPARTWVLQLDVAGKTRRWTLSRFPTVGLEDARALARDYYIAAKDGRDPRAKPADGATLRDAFERHVRSLKTRRKQPRSIADAEGDVERYWSRYLDRELHSFSRVELDDIHRTLTDERGPEAANRACRLFRAAWRNMMCLHESLPDSPTFGITWNRPAEERRPIAWSSFPEFWATIETRVKNPIRADLVPVLVLTGLRSLDARTIE